MKLSVGQKVYLYQSGKGGRETTGMVMKRQGFATLVRFKLWEHDCCEVTTWFVKSKEGYTSSFTAYWDTIIGPQPTMYMLQSSPLNINLSKYLEH
jgi:hypothetical protein